MGQTQSKADCIIPDTVDALHMEFVRHAKVIAEINSLTYEDFKSCLENLNSLSRKCIDPNGKQLVFLIKSGTDTSLLWKATVKVACVKVDTNSRQVESYKFLNLKQFLCVFKTFQAHLESLISSENHKTSRRGSQSPSEDNKICNITASVLMDQVNALIERHSSSEQVPIAVNDSNEINAAACLHKEVSDECSICLDRCVEVILPCAHSFCAPCIEQWNVNNKTCPICLETLDSTDDTWVMSDIPGVEEINEKICLEFMNLTKNTE